MNIPLARRFDSLFTRLLLTQTALILALGLVFGGLFYVDRNITIAVLYAELWAPQLASAAGLSAPDLARAPAFAPAPLLRRDSAPEHARHAGLAPRFAALRHALTAHGVPVDDVMIGLASAEPIVWLHVSAPMRPPLWLGLPGQIIVPEWPERLLTGLLALSLLLVGASWAFTRRLTRPLEQLRQRMQNHTPGNTPAPAQAQASTHANASAPGSSPEIAAIDSAYSDLLARFERHERERAMLLAGVSHDLRSPLGRIRLAAELLPDSADCSARKASIVRNVRVADRLIESFLDFVRADTLPLNDTVDLAALTRAAVARFERPPEELAALTPASAPWSHVNALLLERLISNLADNALQHGRPPVRVSLTAQPDEAWIDVIDAGSGIAPEALAHLQGAFTRGSASRATPGAGLGLAIVRQIASRLGASVTFEQQADAYRVRVTLPKRPNSPPETGFPES